MATELGDVCCWGKTGRIADAPLLLLVTQSGHAPSIGAGAGAALLRAALATDLATDLAHTGRLRFGDAADGVLQMRRPIGQRGLLDRQPIDAGAEQRLPEIALEAVLQEIGRAHAAINLLE